MSAAHIAGVLLAVIISASVPLLAAVLFLACAVDAIRLLRQA